MDFQLNETEVRVLGALMEKEAATPEYYPLSLNALCAACNQRSNREPVMALDDETVLGAVESLREKGLLMRTSGGDHRVPKFGHRAGEVFNFDRREQAVLCVLLLRGPQTVGELRGRTERLHAFEGLGEVEATLHRLMERTPPLAQKLGRQPGEKEPRFAHLLSGEVVPVHAPPRLTAEHRAGMEERVSRMQEELAELRRQFDEFRNKFE
jgi:uncharacterized protein YceH (UPF0502 family)